MNKTAIALLLLFLPTLSPAPRAETPILPFADVEPGMRGEGRTAFSGTEISTFDVEVLGKLPDVAPGRSLILARCSGGPLEHTGVMSGMSGSPVYIDGKLIGAIAYSWGFSKDPIAGITPIEEMLEITRRDPSAPSPRAGAAPPAAADLALLDDPSPVAEFFRRRITELLRPAGGALPVTVPLAVSGIDAASLARTWPELSAAGLVPVQAGSAGSADTPAPRPVPGAPIGLKLIRGDVEVSAMGTVTWVDGDRVLAFGHPLFGLGDVDLPMTAARVEALLPSLLQSSRITVALGETGALRQDRASGVLGLLGATPRMIPVRVQFSSSRGDEESYSFDMTDDPLLAPLLLYMTMNGILTSRERGFGSSTVRLRDGSVIKMLDGEDVELDNLFAGPTAAIFGTGLPAYILHLLMNNGWTEPRIAGINLILEYDALPRTGWIRRASLDRYLVRPGETVGVTLVVGRYRGPDEVLTREVQVPPSTPPGRLTVIMGGALSVSRAEEHDEPVLPRDLGQLIRLINQLRKNDRIYILATREDAGVMLGGARLPNLPPSAASVLSRPRSRGNLSFVPRRAVLEDVIFTEYAVEGWVRVELEVAAN